MLRGAKQLIWLSGWNGCDVLSLYHSSALHLHFVRDSLCPTEVTVETGKTDPEWLGRKDGSPWVLAGP